MKIINLCAVVLLSSLFGCGGSNDSPVTDDALAPEQAVAERFAPAAFREAQALQERANELQSSERSSMLDAAQAKFEEAMTQAEALRAEAQKAANANIGEADLMIQIVQKIRANEPRGSMNLPGESMLREASTTLETARAAYEQGDFVQAGLLAAQVTEMMSRRRAT